MTLCDEENLRALEGDLPTGDAFLFDGDDKFAIITWQEKDLGNGMGVVFGKRKRRNILDDRLPGGEIHVSPGSWMRRAPVSVEPRGMYCPHFEFLGG